MITTDEASMHANNNNYRASRREKIRRETACHKLLEQWQMCQDELRKLTNELMQQLDDYITDQDGVSFSREGHGGPPYELIITEDLNSIGNALDLSQFTSFNVQY